MMHFKHSLPRRKFLGSLATSAAMLGLAHIGIPRTLASTPKAHPVGPSDAELEAWLSKIKGKHRQVFDAPLPDNGMGLAWARVFLTTNKAVGRRRLTSRRSSSFAMMQSPLPWKTAYGQSTSLGKSSRSMTWRRRYLQCVICSGNRSRATSHYPEWGVNELTESGVPIGVTFGPLITGGMY